MAIEENDVKIPQGIVCYSDGATRPKNPGPSGWGLHGYLYRAEPPKKPAGQSDNVLTATGYVLKVEAAAATGKGKSVVEITPVHYIDGYGTFAYDVSNNVAEICATINALKHAANYDITEIQLFTDSEYVRKGLESWVTQWARNNWLKPDGQEPANVSWWKQLIEARDVLTQRGVKVKISWVKGHSDTLDIPDILGNILADKMATIGVIATRRNATVNDITVTAAEGYWKHDTERHPMIANRRMYFNTMAAYVRPGEYYLGEHGKEDDLLGKRISDGAYSVVILEKPEPALELVRNYQVELAGNSDTIVMARLDHIYRNGTHRDLMRYGTLAMEQPDQYRLDLLCLDREPMSRELRPARLAMRAVEAVSELSERLQRFLAGHESIVVTDLTPLLYDITSKTSKKGEVTETLQLNPKYVVGFAAFPVEANYKAGAEVKTTSVTLTLGIDLLDRNALKRLEELKPKVSLITWLEDTCAFRYATVVEAGGDKGIYAGVYSNLRLVSA